jgi:uncharacterized glyoxalase superfamily protein PhnB
VRFSDTLHADNLPEGDRRKVMHVSLPIGNDNILMATDALESMGQTLTVGNNFSISVHTDTKEDADRIFNELSAGGNVGMALADQFWGVYFGMLTGKFGIQWMLNYEYPKSKWATSARLRQAEKNIYFPLRFDNFKICWRIAQCKQKAWSHQISQKKPWAGYIVSALPALFFLFDALGKFVKPEPVVTGTLALGYNESVILPLGILLTVCTILYLVPKTSVLGAILLTGYLGGAVASQVRIGNPLLTHVLFPVYMGILVWLGLYLRDARLRAVIPFRSQRRIIN